jgi:protein SCO1/2
MLLAAAAMLLARIEFFDDRGAIHSTEEWPGRATIIAPVFTRCPVACPLITSGVKKALANRSGTYRVVIFSFDPRDTPADLRHFRERHRLPADWIVASAREPAIHELMDSIGFRYAQVNGGYSHPNLIAGITPDLRLANVLNGTEYRVADIDAMLSGRDWLDRYAGPLVTLLLFAALVSAVILFTPRARTRTRPADC